jgi:hypothetical protein
VFELQLLVDCCRVLCLQNAAIMGMLQQLDTGLSEARRTGTVQELKENLEVARNLAVEGLITGQPASKAQVIYARAGLIGTFGLAKGSA